MSRARIAFCASAALCFALAFGCGRNTRSDGSAASVASGPVDQGTVEDTSARNPPATPDPAPRAPGAGDRHAAARTERDPDRTCSSVARDRRSHAVPAGAPGPLPAVPPTFVTSHGRIVAIGDVHGDLDATRNALKLAGVVDDAGHWVGGTTVAVQAGDVLDRGDQERAILEWFERLAPEAHAAGGAFYSLIGNHEQMNAQQSFGYVTEGGWKDFADVPPTPGDPMLAALEPYQLGRAAAFRPGGPYARILSNHNVIVIVDRTAFVHGGLEPEHVDAGLEALNAEHRTWLHGDGTLSAIWDSNYSLVWNRLYSEDTDEDDCARLRKTLDSLCLDRLVVGHTVQAEGITTACDGRVVRIDVGLSRHYGGPVEALQIEGNTATILR